MKKIIAGMLLFGAIAAGAADTKYATHATLSAVNFKANDLGYDVTAIAWESDKATSDVLVYGRTGSPVAFSAAASSGATTVSVSNADSQIADSDVVLIQYADGAVQYTAVTTATTTNLIIGTALSQAATTSAKVYELTTVGRIVGGSSNGVNTGSPLFSTPTDSPLRVTLDSTSAGWVAATASRK